MRMIQTLLLLVGIFCGSLLLTPWQVVVKNIRKFIILALASMVVSLFFTTLTGIKSEYTLTELINLNVFVAPIIYLAAIAIIFRDTILVQVNEIVLLSLTTIFGCLLLNNNTPALLLFLYAIPALVLISFVFFPVKLTHSWRLLLYYWYLILIILLALYGADLKIFTSFLGESRATSEPMTHGFLAGILCSYIFVHCVYLLTYFIRYQGETESKAEFQIRQRKYFKAISEKFYPSQYPVTLCIVSLVLIIGLFFIREQLDWPSQALLITTLMVAITTGTTYVNKYLFSSKEIGEGDTLDSISNRNLHSPNKVLAVSIAILFIVFIILIVSMPELAKREFEEIQRSIEYLLYEA